MRSDHGRETLWLRGRAAYERPGSSHAILWPAIEFTVLIRTRQKRSDDTGLDPFERAVLGCARAGIVSISEQSRLLDLHPDFVSFINERLIGRRFLDRYGRQGEKAPPEDDEVIESARIYQDPWTGTLWPRYVHDRDRRTLPVTLEDGRPIASMGTTGSPVDIRVLRVEPPRRPPSEPPSSDDANRVVAEWRWIVQRTRGGGPPLHGEVRARVLAGHGEPVHLCCPSSRSRTPRPNVADPFGGPEWAPFVRQLTSEASGSHRLRSWLFWSLEEMSPVEPGPDLRGRVPLTGQDRLSDPTELRIRVADVRASLAPAVPRELRDQARIDLRQIGHEAFDLVESHQPLPPGIDRLSTVERDLIEDLAITFGFELAGGAPPLELRSNRAAVSTLLVRGTTLLLRFRADRGGPLHRLARVCPIFHQTLGALDGAYGGLDDAADAVDHLITLAEEIVGTDLGRGMTDGEETQALATGP